MITCNFTEYQQSSEKYISQNANNVINVKEKRRAGLGCGSFDYVKSHFYINFININLIFNDEI